jgi:hypothetical protein
MEDIQESYAIGILSVDDLLIVSPAGDVVNSARVFYA